VLYDSTREAPEEMIKRSEQFGLARAGSAGMKRLGFLSLSVALLFLVSVAAWANPSARPGPQQRKVPPPPHIVQQRQAQRQAQQQRQAQRQETPQVRRMLDLPPKYADQLRTMTPEQQQRFLNNNERFLSLPPERQAQVRNQLRQWNSLGPEQQQAILDRERVWQSMTPAQQRYVRDTLMPQWQAMTPARKQAILKKLHDLRGLDDSQRAAKLNDGSFNSGLDPGERQMLRDLSGLRVTESGPPGF
jgi:hypothetical protein